MFNLLVFTLQVCNLSFAELLNFDPELAHLLFSHPLDLLPLFDEAAHRSQASFTISVSFSGYLLDVNILTDFISVYAVFSG